MRRAWPSALRGRRRRRSLAARSRPAHMPARRCDRLRQISRSTSRRDRRRSRSARMRRSMTTTGRRTSRPATPSKFTIEVQNTGDVGLTGVAVAVELTQRQETFSPAEPPRLVGGDETNPGILDRGETWRYSARYVLALANLEARDPITAAVVASGEGIGIAVTGRSRATAVLPPLQGIAPRLISLSQHAERKRGGQGRYGRLHDHDQQSQRPRTRHKAGRHNVRRDRPCGGQRGHRRRARASPGRRVGTRFRRYRGCRRGPARRSPIRRVSAPSRCAASTSIRR